MISLKLIKKSILFAWNETTKNYPFWLLLMLKLAGLFFFYFIITAITIITIGYLSIPCKLLLQLILFIFLIYQLTQFYISICSNSIDIVNGSNPRGVSSNNKSISLSLLFFIKTILTSIGYLLFFPGLIFNIKWIIAIQVMIDKEYSITKSLQTSWSLTKNNFFALFIITTIQWFIFLLGIITIIGWMITIPFIQLMNAYIYKTLSSKQNTINN